MRLRRMAAVTALVVALSPSVAGRADIAYRTVIKGASPSELADLLDQVSQLKALENRPPASPEALARRADRDLGGRFSSALSCETWSSRSASSLGDAPLMTVR